MKKTLAEALAAFNRDSVLEQVKNRLDSGEDPIGLMNERNVSGTGRSSIIQ